MAMAAGVVGSCGAAGSSVASSVGGGFLKGCKGRKAGGRGCSSRFVCSAASYTGGLREQYKTLRIEPGASEKEVKRAFRQLARQYHPDVCKGSNCGVQFHQINEAYDIVMRSLREPKKAAEPQEWEDEEEWLGWEGAGMWDYYSRINPSI